MFLANRPNLSSAASDSTADDCEALASWCRLLLDSLLRTGRLQLLDLQCRKKSAKGLPLDLISMVSLFNGFITVFSIDAIQKDHL